MVEVINTQPRVTNPAQWRDKFENVKPQIRMKRFLIQLLRTFSCVVLPIGTCVLVQSLIILHDGGFPSDNGVNYLAEAAVLANVFLFMLPVLVIIFLQPEHNAAVSGAARPSQSILAPKPTRLFLRRFMLAGGLILLGLAIWAFFTLLLVGLLRSG